MGFMFQKRQNRQHPKLSAGVLTVEASVIFPMQVIMAALLIFCLFYRHNLNYYTAAAAETALRGNAAAEGGEDDGSLLMRELAAGRVADQPVPGSAPDIRVSSGDWGSAASFSGQRFAAFRDWFVWEEEISVPKVHPAKTLRQRWTGAHE